MARAFADLLASRLTQARNPDGGCGPRPGVPSEPEPTALVALALDDADARAWLRRNQLADGSWGIAAGPVVNVSATPLAALATGDRAAVEFLATHGARQLDRAPEGLPMDVSVRGWGWTSNTFGWVEPTARGLLAMRRLSPGTAAPIDDAVAFLADRACVGGGWNYGNRVVWGKQMEPFVQPTAWALIALQGIDHPMVTDGYAALRANWAVERGGLSLALTVIAMRLETSRAPAGEIDAVLDALEAAYDTSGFLDDVGTLALATMACDPSATARLHVDDPAGP